MNPIDREVLLEYVMGSLTPEREKEVAAYLRQNPNDAAWVRDMFEAVAKVALSQEPATVPANSADDLLKRIRKESEAKAGPAPVIQAKPRRMLWAFLGMGSGMALALVLWFGGGRLAFENYQIAQQLNRMCSESSCQTLFDDSNKELGTLVRKADNTLLVVFKNNPPKGQVYQGWEISESGAASIGVYEGRIMRIAQPLKVGNTFGVTLEPPGGSPQPTTTPIVVYKLS
jgi:anti-sigma-K factor RskA